ncbi:MAG: hypothetical protein VX733_09790 [Candidatus Latescibacterota bacterium]|nr:hypothetical protein [Candidatus Latescibacterota bacterium]
MIRQTLEKDRSGRRRGDAELVMSAFRDNEVVVYDGHASIDTRAWTVLHESREAFGSSLVRDLQANDYDIERTVTFINVWEKRAFATVLDSGMVTDRATGESRVIIEEVLWTFLKEDEQWRATALVVDVGDSTSGPAAGSPPNAEVQEALVAEAAAWSEGNARDVLSHVDEGILVIECGYSSNPAKWLTIFSTFDELEKWVDGRLDRMDYEVDRQVVHTSVGANRSEAIAVTRDVIRAKYFAGDAEVRQERLSTWMLTRQGGDWKARQVLIKSKPFAPTQAVLFPGDIALP